MFSVEFIWNAQQAQDYLKATGKSAKEMKPLLLLWLEDYRKEQRRIFASHSVGNNGGGGDLNWKPLSPAYVMSHIKKSSRYPQAIMRLTGRLEKALTVQGVGTPDTILHVTTNDKEAMLEFGANLPYAAAAGGVQGGSRQVMYITPQFMARMTDQANHFLSGLIAANRKGNT